VSVFDANNLGIAFIYCNGSKTNYLIDYLGDVFNCKTKKFLKIHSRIPSASSNGTYKFFKYRFNGKAHKRIWSRQMMISFYPVPNMDNLEVDHINTWDEDYFHNWQWLTKEANLAKRQFDTPF